MPTKVQIKKKIKNFIEFVNKDFTTDNLLGFIEAEFELQYLTEKQMDQIFDILDYDLNYLVAEKRIQSEKYQDSIYISRKKLFTNSKFLIKPTDYELKRGILIGGHRFTPFCSPKLFPDKVKLIDSTTHKTVLKKKISAKSKDLIIFYTILGLKVMYEDLSRINENAEKLIDIYDTNTDLMVRANNMTLFYKSHAFKSGDYILAEVIDYEKGICNIQYLPIESLQNSIGEINNWCLEFEKAIQKTVEEHEPFSYDLNMSQQLSEAFYITDKTLLKKPVIHLGGFLKLSKKVHLVNQERHSLMWDKNKDFTPPGVSLMNQKIDELTNEELWYELGNEELKFTKDVLQNLDDESLNQYTETISKQINRLNPNKFKKLDDVLKYMGYCINKDELEAYMKDELFSGKNKLSNVKNRCFDNRDIYYPEAAEKLKSFTQKLWNRVEKSYNIFADKRVGKLRSKLLELNDRNTEWQRKIDNSNGKVSLKDIPQELMEILIQITPQLTQLIADLNKPNKINNQEIKLLEKMIEQIIPLMTMTIDSMNKTVDELIIKS